MPGIETLVIRDFQAHKLRKINLDPNVTTIVGPTDAGKSAILRALRWLMLNQPSGFAFIHWDSTRAKVKLKVDGQWVSRIRAKVDNTYRLGKQEFKSFKTSVPEPIAELLRVDDVNFQTQLSALFWFALTPSQVSHELNAMVDLDAMDAILSKAASNVRKLGTAVSFLQERVGRFEKEIEYNNQVEAAYEQAHDIKRLVDQEMVMENDRRQLARRISQVKEAQEAQGSRKLWRQANAEAMLLQTLEGKTDRLRKGIEALRSSCRQLRDLQATVKECKTERKRLQALTKNCPTCGKPL